MRWVEGAALAAAGAALVLGTAAPAAAQRADDATVRVSAFVAGSLREGAAGFGVARDVRSASVRLTLPRQLALQPWLQFEAFTRPELECPGDVTCNTDGWTALGGVVLPLSPDDTRPGLNLYFLAGLGWAFSEDDDFAYLFGIGAAMPLNRRVAPSMEIRWEDLPGIRNVLMVNFGLRLDLF